MDTTFDILHHAAKLRADRVPFVLATVTVSRKPTSAPAGSRAVITRDGALFGWIGGACSQPSVVRHALEALAAGETRVIRLSPDADAPAREGVLELQMTCHSGGTLEIFLEPFWPAPRLLVVGAGPVATHLAELAERFDLSVEAARQAAELPTTIEEPPPYIVVATMGIEDDLALERALALQPAYLGMVGSRHRFTELAGYLRSRGFAEAVVDAVHAPAGLDIGARTPQEIALSVLAEIVQQHRTSTQPLRLLADQEPTEWIVTDPICGMSVDLRTARHTLTVDGVTYGFCCPACLRRFQEERAAG